VLANASAPRVNLHAHLYEELTDEKLAATLSTGFGRGPASAGPRKEDYEQGPVPDRLRANKREFPDP
jgi:hypothetical protein